MKQKTITLELKVTVPEATEGSAVKTAINSLLDEPSYDWEDWVIGAAYITNVEKI